MEKETKKILMVSIRSNCARGGLAYERGGDARRKFWIKPLKETDLCVGQAFLTPKRDHIKTQTNEKTWIIWME